MPKIKKIIGSEILDSRGNPTVRVRVYLSDGTVGCASVPSGASTGSHEALELRDGNPKRYGGKGVLSAVVHVNGSLAESLKQKDVTDQRAIDGAMIALDGTENKSRLGANAILGISLACAHAGAAVLKVPLYKYLRAIYGLKEKNYSLPRPMMNVLNGGVHADSGLAIQECMIMPAHEKFSERVRMGAEVFHALSGILHKKHFQTLVGDEGGFAPHLGSNEKALSLLVDAIKKAGYKPGVDVSLAIDFAASEFYDAKKKKYTLNPGKRGLSAAQMVGVIERWSKKFPLVSIEDPLAEDDWEHWATAQKKLGKKLMIVGDDLFVTNQKRLAYGIDVAAANAILIKLNQIGTLSETVDCIGMAKTAGYHIVVSHRSGETADTTIADLAVAVSAEYIKTGSLSRSERVEKYNRLMEIEQEVLP